MGSLSQSLQTCIGQVKSDWEEKMAAALAPVFVIASLAHAKPQVGFGFPSSPSSSSSSSSSTFLEQRVSNTCTTLSGSTCVFPFVYNGQTHFQCTYSDSPTPWCATAVDSNNQVPTCTTTSGPRPGQSCVFPFRHLGIVYTACTSVGEAAPWCSTSTTSAGTHIDGEYGFCPSTCPADTTSSATTTTTTTTTTTSTTPTVSSVTTTTTQVSTSCTPGT